ncbi:GtrA family protein [Paractinoplanes lichenicola]|uniref:GtrA family protein n=1 Tax=Paractinoplanes lichenicola TaxID=2802976 RepID=A0ABS1VV67_9ACTN|nr:GtrA family protein [Actinoplanes lichenicola]MBL7258339.1 GtrA family protein [Actinoplanes lichenicola]
MWLTRMWSKHHEAAKFLLVGGVCFLVTTGINFALKLTVLHEKPVTALAIATTLATVLSYVLNREWSFRHRGGRERHHEALMFFTVSAIAIVLNLIPLGVSRYVLDMRTPDVSRPVQEIADFVSGIILGTLVAMVFKLWAFKRFVFPEPTPRKKSRPGPRSKARMLSHQTEVSGPESVGAASRRRRRTGRA